MKLEEAMNQCDNLKPNQYQIADKVRWLNDIESQIKKEIIDTHANTEQIEFTEYEMDDLNAELLVTPPYSDLYIKYLMAQIDFCNGEMARYNNSALMFNIAYQSFLIYYHNNHMPLNKGIIIV